MQKNRKNYLCGFTMIEILLTLAIIAILGTIVFAGASGQRQRARVTAAVASVKSAMTPAMTCVSLDGKISAPMAGSIGGGAICSGSEEFSEPPIVWPTLTNGCFYCGMSENTVLFRCSGSCGDGNESFCDYQTTQCERRY
ncbi:MAG: type II secretion system protein [Patescibacteria group bacterium]|nr:type II secretion system protein [Patescibacteria group bacterium]